jgi:ABC-type phosphate/phosphonate transport system substrate-binding protein
MSPRIAALPMYDLPALSEDHDRLWEALAMRLTAYGVRAAPAVLTRGPHHFDLWRDPGLLLGQACEYPLASLAGFDVRLVASPRYRAPGCAGARYRSAIVVREADRDKPLAAMRGARCAVNETSSNSGMNLLRAAVARLAQDGRFFGEIVISGGHRLSLDLIAAGRADLAAIDCVTLAHVRRHEPWRWEGLAVQGWTEDSPSLPYITAGATSDATLSALRSALADIAADPSLAAIRGNMLLDGFDFAPDREFTRVRALARNAADQGYPVLA